MILQNGCSKDHLLLIKKFKKEEEEEEEEEERKKEREISFPKNKNHSIPKINSLELCHDLILYNRGM